MIKELSLIVELHKYTRIGFLIAPKDLLTGNWFAMSDDSIKICLLALV